MLTKISYKLIVAVGSVALLIIGIFAYGILSAHQEQLIGEVRRSALQLSETVKSSTHYDMLLNQRESVHRIITTIGKQDGNRKFPGAPSGTYCGAGHNNNMCFVVPEWNMVIVRLGLDENKLQITDAVYSTFIEKVGQAIVGGPGSNPK